MKKIKKIKDFAQKVRSLIHALPVLILITSCGGSGAGSSGSASGSLGSSTGGNLYAVAVNTQRQYSLGYDVSYTCDSTTCTLTGEFHHYRYNFADITVMQIFSATLTKNGSGIYTGTICDNAANCYVAQMKIETNKIILESAGKCTMTQQTTTQGGYDAFIASFAPGQVSNPSHLFFNNLTTCSM